MGNQLVLDNARVYTVDEDFSRAEAVLVDGNRIRAVGSREDVQRRADEGARVVDLQGRVVVPGFMDSHLHPVYAGKNLAQVQLLGCTSIAEALERIRARAAELSAGEWFRGSNHWSVDLLEERRLPYRHELDEASPDNPFWVNVAFHRAAGNSLALRAAGIDAETPEHWGNGYVFKDAGTGEPNGHLLEAAMFACAQQQPLETPEQILRGIENVQELLLSHGITSVVDQGDVGPPFVNFKLLQRLWDGGGLRLRWRVNHIGFEMADMPADDIDAHIASIDTVSGFGDDWLRMGAIGELVLDGFIEDAWTRQPYAEDVFGSGWCGIRLFTPERVEAIMLAAARHGMQMNVHCEGDAALDHALDTFETVHRQIPIDDRKWTLEHGGLNPTEKNLDQCRRMGVVVGTQQPLQYWHSHGQMQFMGDQAARYFQNRTWLDNGIHVRGGSDFDTAPLSPLFGIWTAVARKNIRGEAIGPEEAVSREEALVMYTRAAAESVFEGDRKGSLEVGKLADLVVLSDDLMEVAEDEIAEIEVVATMVDGNWAYGQDRL